MKLVLIMLFSIFALSHSEYTSSQPVFQLRALGVQGGLDDGNLSSYLVKPINSENYVSLDSGTLVNGLLKTFGQSAGAILTNHIPAFLISHAHFDHYMGFVMAQPELRQQQTVMAREETMQALLMHVFNWSVWGNFGDKGEAPQLKFQHYQSLPLLVWQDIPGTDMQVKAYPLNHGHGFPSTAFLIRYDQSYLLYFGDTGADKIEHSRDIEFIWSEIAPLIQQKQLLAILLECSYKELQPDNLLFGHLKPSLFMSTFHQLARITDPNHPETVLKGLTVFITHVKPEPTTLGTNDNAQAILAELEQLNDINLHLVLPEQGEHYEI